MKLKGNGNDPDTKKGHPDYSQRKNISMTARNISPAAAAHKSFAEDFRKIRRNIHDEVAGCELEILKSLGIVWPPPGRRLHITCPFPDHHDHDPSWRWDAHKSTFFCTCDPGHGSIIDVMMRMRGLSFNEAAAAIRGEYVPARPPNEPDRARLHGSSGVG